MQKKGVPQPNRRQAVYCKELDITFESVTEAGIYLHENLGMSKQARTQVGMACIGKTGSCGKIKNADGTITKLTWIFINKD